MKLIRQVILYFKEGNSDKVYEIDLCEVNGNKFVVNFRYGRRGVPLKEGTKTEQGVDRLKAESIFNNLESEKMAKGYRRSEAQSDLSVCRELTPQKEAVPLPVSDIQSLPEGREKAILLRLKNAVEGNRQSGKSWRLSRVVWRAGDLKIKDAAPYIIHLCYQGDSIHQYSCVWALGRIGDPVALPLVKELTAKGTPVVKRMAWDVLLHLSGGEARENVLEHHFNSIVEPIKNAVKENKLPALKNLLRERVLEQSQTDYKVVEHLYAISVETKWIKEPLLEIISEMPCKPGYFKHLRHLYKLAEFRDDFELLGILATKFERQPEFFSNNILYKGQKKYITELETYINTVEELKKKNSTLAYSNKTRYYFRNRSLKRLDNFGKLNDPAYVKMATGILLSYNGETDYRRAYSDYYYVWSRNNYQRQERKYPENAHATLLLKILKGDSATLKLTSSFIWQVVHPVAQALKSNTQTPPQSSASEASGGLFKKIIGFFGSKKEEPKPELPKTVENPKPEIEKSPIPYLQLWNQLPQAFIQLLVKAKMNEVHVFALSRLKAHPEYHLLKDKIDNNILTLLLRSGFDIPANFGFDLAKERYNPSQPDLDLIKAVLAGRIPEGRNLAKEWISGCANTCFSNSEWVSEVLFNPYEDVRSWLADQLKHQYFSPSQAEVICGRVIVKILATENTDEHNNIVRHATEIVLNQFATALLSINNTVIEDLIKHVLPAAQVFGLNLLLLKKDSINYDTISSEVFKALINNPAEDVRETAVTLLEKLSVKELLNRQELVISCSISPFSNVRIASQKVIAKLANENAEFGVNVVNYLLPLLLRKEPFEGFHQDISSALQNTLINHVKDANKELVLKLVYSNYIPTQEFGIAILNKYVDASEFTIRQIIALGNHETLTVREWCWQYFKENIARIKYERDETIRLLDSDWEDTRIFAKVYFKEHFTEKDWSIEALVGIADSVRPDIEAYGRALITLFFNEEANDAYLIKLSQHPSVKMQLFATNYLERYAIDNLSKLEQLSYYFKSVLTRVNKARTAKNRIFKFLLTEGVKSEAAARFVAGIITDISATVSIEDKAKCIEILHAIHKIYHVETPVQFKPILIHKAI
ncbi:WGR domain-containing protein [Polluticaenibacter yanchengensis]|uniref:WGR domain-containing protein n=1 Tax=Polluticaenibacter yanchengensis TaxID=3014562 RepID=A0ABT4ULU7_9BACT|nr:WGR domain-containing protein [Chitinophagaceae bacterium LY-5]